MGRSAIIGNHLHFIPEGETVDAITVAADAKPDKDPTTNWTDYKLGTIVSASAVNDVSSVTVRAPAEDVGGGTPGGVYQAIDEFAVQQNLEWNCVMGQLNPTAYRAIWMSGAITDGGGGTGGTHSQG